MDQARDGCRYSEDLHRSQASIQVTDSERLTSTLLTRPPMVTPPGTQSVATLPDCENSNAYSAKAEDDVDYRIRGWRRSRR